MGNLTLQLFDKTGHGNVAIGALKICTVICMIELYEEIVKSV